MDRREREEFLRDLVEYGMAFHNFEAVKQVQKSRELKQSAEYQESEQIFMEQVEKLFGRKLDPSHLKQTKNNQNNEINESDLDQDNLEQDVIRIHKADE